MSTLKLTRFDLDPFADLGTAVKESASYIYLTRNDTVLRIEGDSDRYVVTSPDGEVQRYPNAARLLAAEPFANLPKMARNQAAQLSEKRVKGRPVPIRTKMDSVFGPALDLVADGAPWNSLDRWLRERQLSQQPNTVDLLLINGPAGVGKSTLIQETALLRAEAYDGTSPLILQIASRGRVLQNIGDLIAFALQDVRSGLVVKELGSLMRHGLITLAIDGFDELSDPNGFETAWSGLNEVISTARGRAAVLLAGRETFVSTETMRKQLGAVNEGRGDRLASLLLTDPEPVDAREWLLGNEGWTPELLARPFVEPLFEQGSYALRPFFLDLIAREPSALTSDAPPAADLLGYLVSVMTEREADKFVERLDPPDGSAAASKYEAYVERLLEEISRDMAENQSDSITEDALDLIATVAAEGILPADQIAAVVQRANTVVFLAKDILPGRVRFAHEQLLDHFLSREALRSVGEGELPRYIRRNLFSREALEIFANAARDRSEEAKQFLDSVRAGLLRPTRDRTHTSLAALGIAAMSAIAPEGVSLRIEHLGLGEVHFPFAAPKGIAFRDVAISILYAKGADLRAISFEDGVQIATLEIDRLSLLPPNMPIPQTLVYWGGTTADGRAIAEVLAPKSFGTKEGAYTWPEDLVELLVRIDRYRPFWLRIGGEVTQKRDWIGRKIVGHPNWPRVYDALQKLDLVTVKTLGASGRPADFVHFRKDISLMDNGDLYSALTS